MSDFRKQIHVAYKKKLCEIVLRYIGELAENENEWKEYLMNPKLHIERWIDRHCLPMGDFSKEDAIKEMETWQE